MFKKSLISGNFPMKLRGAKIYFKIIFEKPLDFFRLSAHTMRAFKLGTNQK